MFGPSRGSQLLLDAPKRIDGIDNGFTGSKPFIIWPPFPILALYVSLLLLCSLSLACPFTCPHRTQPFQTSASLLLPLTANGPALACPSLLTPSRAALTRFGHDPEGLIWQPTACFELFNLLKSSSWNGWYLETSSFHSNNIWINLPSRAG